MKEEEQSYEKAVQAKTIQAAAATASAKKEQAMASQVKQSTDAALKEVAELARRKSLTE